MGQIFWDKFFGTKFFGTNFFWTKFFGTVAIYEPDIADVESYTVMQGYLENSNVSAIQEMIGLIEVSRAHEANQKMIQTFDQNIGKAIGTLGQTS